MSVLALLAIPAIPILKPLVIVEKSRKATHYIQFKASPEIIKDKDAFKSLIDKYNTKGTLIKTELGWINDDFANDLFTVRLYFA